MKYLWPDNPGLRARVVAAVSMLVAGKVLNIQVPLVMKYAIDAMSISPEMGMIVVPSALILGYGGARILSSLFYEFRTTVFAKVAQTAIRNISCNTFLHLHNMDLSWHLSRQTGGLSRTIERGTRGIQQVLTSIVFNFFPTILEIFLVIGLLGGKFGLAYAGLVGATVTSYFLYTYLVTKWRTRFRISMNRLENIAADVALDSLINFETVKYFSNEKLEVERYRKILEKYDAAQIKVTSSLGMLNFGQSLIFSVALVSGMFMASYGVAAGTMTIGDIVMINGLLLQLSFPLSFLGSTYREIRQSLIDMGSMLSVLDLKASVNDKDGAKPIDLSHSRDIEFKNVHFGYGHNQILKGIDFKVESGKKVAIVGTSGGGKTTVIRLLYRFYDTQDGDIFIAGQNIKDVTQDSLRKAIGIVPQDLVLFNDTILYNILYGKPSATIEEVENAAKLANIHDIIMKMPNGYDTEVGERGLKLSGGEKQRVCLARALLKDSPIVVLDEATSSLDAESENFIHNAFEKVSSSGKTILMISHRLKTVRNADKIIVLNNGFIAEEGTHDELVSKGGIYHELVKKQNI